jgi:hypothetical protein
MTLAADAAEPTRHRGLLAWAPVVPVAAFALAIVRSLSPPNEWAAAQAVFTCDLAPKRCGYGSALALLHVDVRSLDAFHVVSNVALAIALALLLWRVIRSRLAGSAEGSAMLTVLALTYGFGMFVALTGYLDVPMAALVGLAVLAPPRWRGPAAVVAVAAGMTIHEGFLVMFVPTLLLPQALVARRPRDLAWAAGAAILAVAMALSLALHRPLSHDQALAAARTLQTRIDYPLPADAVQVLGRSLADNLRLMRALAATRWFWSVQMAASVLFLPAVILFAGTVLMGWAIPWTRKALAILVALSPLAMNLLGFDVVRWTGMSAVCMAFALAALAELHGPPRMRKADLFVLVALLLSPIALFLPRPLEHIAGWPADVRAITERL